MKKLHHYTTLLIGACTILLTELLIYAATGLPKIAKTINTLGLIASAYASVHLFATGHIMNGVLFLVPAMMFLMKIERKITAKQSAKRDWEEHYEQQ
jgi:DMSO/TMAO reductase YedYZ heme-binding membrane subunit